MADNNKPSGPNNTNDPALKNINTQREAMFELNKLSKEHNLTWSQIVLLTEQAAKDRKELINFEKEIAAIVNGRYEDELSKNELLKLQQEQRTDALKTYKETYQKLKDLQREISLSEGGATEEQEKEIENLKGILNDQKETLKVVDQQIKATQKLNFQLETQKNFFKEIAKTLKSGLADALGLSDVYQNMNRGFMLSQALTLKYAASTAALLKTVSQTNSEFTRLTGQEIDRTLGNFGSGMARFGIGYKQMADSMGKLYVSMSGFSKLNKEQQDQLTSTAAKMNLLGVAAETTGQNYNILTKSMHLSTSEADKAIEDLSRAAIGAGIAPKKMADEFASNMSRLMAFGNQAKDVYIDLQKQAKSLGMELSGLTAIIGEQWDTFEGSARSAGRLNALLGGPFINSVEMLNAKDNERLLILKKGLDASGKNFQSLTQHEQRAYAAAMGIKDLNQATQLFTKSTAELTMDMQTQAASQEKLEKAQKSAAETTAKVSEIFNSFLIIIKPLVSILGTLVDIFAYIADLGDGLGGRLMALLTVIIAWQKTKATFFMVGGGLKNIIMGMRGLVSAAGSAVGALGNFFGSFFSGSKSVADASSALTSGAKSATDAANAAKAAGGAGAGISEAQKAVATTPNAAQSGGFVGFMRSFREGLQQFAESPGKTLLGVIVLGLSIIGLGLAFKVLIALLNDEKIKNPGVMIAFGLSLFILASSIKRMSEVNISLGRVFMFTLAAVILGTGLMALGFAFMIFSKIDLAKVLGSMLLLLAAFGVALLIGMILANPITLLAFTLGVKSILALSLALAVFGIALNIISDSLVKSSQAFKTFDSLSSELPEKLWNVSQTFASLKTIMLDFSILDIDFTKQINAIASLSTSINNVPDTKINAIKTLQDTLTSMSNTPEDFFKKAAEGIKLIGEAINTLPDGKTVTLSTLNETLKTVKSLKEEDIAPTNHFIQAAASYYQAQAASKDADKDALIAALKEVLVPKENKETAKNNSNQPIRMVLDIDGKEFAGLILDNAKLRQLFSSIG